MEQYIDKLAFFQKLNWPYRIYIPQKFQTLMDLIVYAGRKVSKRL